MFLCSVERRLCVPAFLPHVAVRSLIVCGESTSGCVRASCVDGCSSGYHVVVVKEYTFDRSALIHKINLFDLHHKYADVLSLAEVVAHLGLWRRSHGLPAGGPFPHLVCDRAAPRRS